ncbi:MAG TPA: hypothetical protein VLZ28_04750 [Daejeonella sp.]|nr:hypothetical protein [Daejeonella sp.]
MTRNLAFTFFILFGSFSLSAQTIRTNVTVVGGSPAGISAGIQAARSGVKSLIVEEGQSLNPAFTPNDLIFLERIRDHYRYKKEAASGEKDSVKREPIRAEDASKLIKAVTDTVKNLTVMLSNSIKEIEKDGKGWQIKLQNGRTIKTDVIVDASKNQAISAFLKIEPQKTIIQIGNWFNTPESTPRLFRTSLAYGTVKSANKAAGYLIPAATLMPVGLENLFLIPEVANGLHPEAMLAGQAAGASAAFCAFFKTTSKNLNIRVTQGELLAYDARLIPYRDIDFNDRHAIAFQHTGLSGILKAKQIQIDGKDELIFDTLGTISSEELRLPMREFYSRSQIWFADHKKDSLTIDDTIKLLMFTATRGEELRREIEKGWKDSHKLNSTFDPKRAINRREFAVLTDTYLQPFNRRIDLSGNLLN